MINDLGSMIRKLRIEKGLSQRELSEEVFCSRQYIGFFERNLRPLPDELVLPLSSALNFNFEQFIKNRDSYKTVEHYLLSHDLRTCINKLDPAKIQKILKNKIVQNEFTYGSPYILKMYCAALVKKNVDNDLNGAKKILLKTLGIKTSEELENFVPIFHNEDRYYSCIILLINILSLQQDFDLSKNLSTSTIEFIKNNYFPDDVPNDSATLYFRRLYVALTNNHSNIMFIIQDYEEALTSCNRALEIVVITDLLYSLEVILKMKIEILYKLKRLKEAQNTYTEFRMTCKLKGNEQLFIRTNKFFNENLKDLKTCDLE